VTEEKRTNFFIVGAPKCGTTSLAYYLNFHQNIFISNPKEPHFFAADLPKYKKVRSFADYLSLYESAPESACYLGDASPNYLRSEEGIQNIWEFNDQAVFVVILRNPAELVQSWHSHLVSLGEEKRGNFLDVWENRVEPDYHFARDPKDLAYDEVAALGDQVEKLLSVVPREKIFLVLFDDFVQRTPDVFEGIIDWLGLPASNHQPDFVPINQKKVARNRALQPLVNVLPDMLGPFWRVARRRPWLREGIRKVLLKPEKGLTPDQLQKVRNYFIPQIQKLERLTGFDLAGWKG